jgi:glycosyltransferase involved in cell wall biosynthesis
MKVALISFEFYPSIGGVSRHLTSFCKAFRGTTHQLYIFNQGFEGNNIFDILERKNYSLKDVFLHFKKKQFLYTLILSIRKIFSDKQISFSDKLKILFYFAIKPKNLVRTIINIQRLYPYFKKYDFDIIIGGSLGANVLNLILLLSILFEKKVVAWAHGNEFLIRSYFSFKTYFLNNLDKIILSNNQIKNLIKQTHNLDERKLIIIPYGLTINDYELATTKEKIREEFNISPDVFIILSVGRHVPRKNFELVIQAVKDIKDLNPEYKIKYYLIGQGSETPKLKTLSKDLGIENDVFFLGSCEESTRNKFYKISDVFVMPSIKIKESVEGFGLVFLEANLFKIPVIGTLSGGIKEAILDGKTGFLIEQGDKGCLVEKISFLYNNKKKSEEMGEFGQKRVFSSFNWDKIILLYIELFEALTKTK